MSPTPPKKQSTSEEIIIVPAKSHKSEVSFTQGSSSKQEDDVLNITISKKDKKNKLKRTQPDTPAAPAPSKTEKKRIKIDLSQN